MASKITILLILAALFMVGYTSAGGSKEEYPVPPAGSDWKYPGPPYDCKTD